MKNTATIVWLQIRCAKPLFPSYLQMSTSRASSDPNPMSPARLRRVSGVPTLLTREPDAPTWRMNDVYGTPCDKEAVDTAGDPALKFLFGFENVGMTLVYSRLVLLCCRSGKSCSSLSGLR